MLNLASSAIIAKAHALYGQRLTAADYDELLRCKSVSAVALYLKTQTGYADTLEDVLPQSIHRGRLETLLKERLLHEYAKLSRYESSSGKSFYQYFIMRGEVEQLLSCLSLLRSPNHDEYLLRMPAFFDSHTKLDLFRLAQAQSAAQVLEAVRGTPYEAALAPWCTAGEGEEIPLAQVDTALYRLLYESVKKLILKQYSGKHLSEVARFLGIHLDMLAITALYRLKRMGQADALQLREKVYMGLSNLRKQQQEQLLAAQTAQELLQYLQQTGYAAHFAREDFAYVEDAAQRAEYAYAARAFRYSRNATVVMLAYLFLAENETNNIIHIIEGIRYALPPGEIEKMLVGVPGKETRR